MTIKKFMHFLFCFIVTLGVATPAFAWQNDSEQPGSVLVFHKFIRGTYNDFVNQQTVQARTEIEISVRCPEGAACTKDTVVRMRAHWVCPGCTETSFDLKTTVNGSLYFNPEGVTVLGNLVTANAFPNNATTTIAVPNCPRGYLIVWVINDQGQAIKYDGLIGDAVLREGTTPQEWVSARSYNAVPIQAADWLSTGDPTDLDWQGDLDFDGSEYRPITGKIFGTVRYEDLVAPFTVQTYLTLLTLDVVANRANPVTTVGLNFYTTGEDLVDAATSFLCWAEVRLTTINSTFTDVSMGRKGLLESTYAEQQLDFFTSVPVTLLGIVETKEFIAGFQYRDYSYSLYNDGNPVETTFKP